MKHNAKTFTTINYVLSGILWLLGILTLLFNAVGLWAPWHLAGFGFIFFIPVPIIPLFLSILFSCIAKETKCIVLNFVSLALSAGFVMLTIFVSANWFW